MYLTVEVAVRHNTCFTLFSNDMCFLVSSKLLNKRYYNKSLWYIWNNTFIKDNTQERKLLSLWHKQTDEITIKYNQKSHKNDVARILILESRYFQQCTCISTFMHSLTISYLQVLFIIQHLICLPQQKYARVFVDSHS